ncbi:hypothetical protein G9A89_003135 [Geosiphon pyriformis]|nr:hypothetical protein G9A89_003135 [Geosiphon pyriformis]
MLPLFMSLVQSKKRFLSDKNNFSPQVSSSGISVLASTSSAKGLKPYWERSNHGAVLESSSVMQPLKGTILQDILAVNTRTQEQKSTREGNSSPWQTPEDGRHPQPHASQNLSRPLSEAAIVAMDRRRIIMIQDGHAKRMVKTYDSHGLSLGMLLRSCLGSAPANITDEAIDQALVARKKLLNVMHSDNKNHRVQNVQLPELWDCNRDEDGLGGSSPAIA